MQSLWEVSAAGSLQAPSARFEPEQPVPRGVPTPVVVRHHHPVGAPGRTVVVVPNLAVTIGPTNDLPVAIAPNVVVAPVMMIAAAGQCGPRIPRARNDDRCSQHHCKSQLAHGSSLLNRLTCSTI